MKLSESYKNKFKQLAGFNTIKYKGVNIVRSGNWWIVKAGIEPEFVLLSDATDWIDKRV
jgi:hypothetical protein